VVSVGEVRPGSTDLEVAVWADREARVLITDDFDFGDLAVRHARLTSGLVIVACAGMRNSDIGERVSGELSKVSTASLKGHPTVIEQGRVRRRAL